MSEVAGALNDLGCVYFNQRRYDESEPLLKRVIGICKKLRVDEHFEVMTAMNKLAHQYFFQGKNTKEACELNRRANEIREKNHGQIYMSAAMPILESLAFHLFKRSTPQK